MREWFSGLSEDVRKEAREKTAKYLVEGAFALILFVAYLIWPAFRDLLLVRVPVAIVLFLVAVILMFAWSLRTSYLRASAQKSEESARHAFGSVVVFGTYWKQQNDHLWKVHVSYPSMTSAPIEICTVDGPLCLKCRAGLSGKPSPWWALLAKPFQWSCPDCGKKTETDEEGDVLRVQVWNVVQGEIDRKVLLRGSPPIEWTG